MTQRNEETRLGVRTAGYQDLEGGGGVYVQHVYSLDPVHCPEGHEHPDPGQVGLSLDVELTEVPEDGMVGVYLTEGEALRLAAWLTRAVGWIDDAQDEGPDIERELLRLKRQRERGPDG